MKNELKGFLYIDSFDEAATYMTLYNTDSFDGLFHEFVFYDNNREKLNEFNMKKVKLTTTNNGSYFTQELEDLEAYKVHMVGLMSFKAEELKKIYDS